MDNAVRRNYCYIKVRPIAFDLGAEIEGVDLTRSLEREVVSEIRQAFLDYLVIFFGNQELTPQEQLAFAQRLGQPMEYPQLKGLPECPLVTAVTKLEHERANFGGVWHSDTTYLERPPMASMLYAVEIPPYGGDTLFANQYMAYETLSEGLKKTLDAWSGQHLDETRGRQDAGGSLTRGRRGAESARRSASCCAYAPGDGPQSALRQQRPHDALRGLDGAGEPASAQLSLRAPGQAGVHLPLSLGARLPRLLG